MALSEERIYGYNESVRSDGVMLRGKLTTLAFYTHFRLLVCARLGLSDKDF